MKTVRLKNNVVAEIIPEYALPVEKWYGATFASQCVEAPDEVGQRWVFDPETGLFSAPEPEPMPEVEPTQIDVIEAQVYYTAMMTDTLLEE